MLARYTDSDNDANDALKVVAREVQPAQLREAFFHDQPATHRVLNRLRLLEDFLEHEVLEAALFDLIEIPVDAAHALADTACVEIQHLVSVAGEHAHLAVVEVHDLSRVLEDRGDVAGDVELALPESEQQRASLARADDLVRIARRDHSDAIRPFD